MNRENRFLKLCADSSFDTTAMPGLSLVEVYGSKRVLIENHRGIVSYGCNEIGVKVKEGHICVAGERLMITKMSKEKLVIVGKIHCVKLQGRG